MTFGKPDGKHFNFTFLLGYGVNIFIPYREGCLSFGFNWRMMNVVGFKPCISFFQVNTGTTFARMYHLRYPYNVIKVGTWK